MKIDLHYEKDLFVKLTTKKAIAIFTKSFTTGLLSIKLFLRFQRSKDSRKAKKSGKELVEHIYWRIAANALLTSQVNKFARVSAWGYKIPHAQVRCP